MGVCVFVFRRDLRVHDNTAFIEAVKKATANNWQILPVFIFNKNQIDPNKNKYHSNTQVQFMIQSLEDMSADIQRRGGKLMFLHTDSDLDAMEQLLRKLQHQQLPLAAVAFNKDITPFARQRDVAIKEWCEKRNLPCLASEDYTMLPIEKVQTKTGKTYEVFTPFYRKAVHMKVDEPKMCPADIPWIPNKIVNDMKMPAVNMHQFFTANENVRVTGGRSHALNILDNLKKGQFKTYKTQRDIPSKEATTGLSPFIKFGCVSIREVHKVAKVAMGRGSTLVEQLFWREFYYNIAYSFPEVLQGQTERGQRNTFVHGKYERAKWNTSTDDFERWSQGNTGVPIVDAAMRCMNHTGWMHNRLRMIVAMFLVRFLGIDWRKGEQYFAQKLVDYDAANNNQGWCWAVSYRRQLNPYKQAGRFDPNAVFIKTWVAELAAVPVLDIITWWERHGDHRGTGYPAPMISIPGYRVKLKTYIPGYVRPKPEKPKKKKTSKYAGNEKNRDKYVPKRQSGEMVRAIATPWE